MEVKQRMLVLLALFGLVMLGLMGRAFWIQIVNGEWYAAKAFDQQNRNREITANRGTIYDRNLKELAVSASVEKVSVSPVELRKDYSDLDGLAGELASILRMDKAVILKKMARPSRYEILKRRVDRETTDKVRKLKSEKKVPGLNVDEDTMRLYPNGNLGAHIVGFTGGDNQGLYGIEQQMDEYLKGIPGKILSEVDAGGREVPFNEEKRIEPQDGNGVVLTIDEAVQHFARKELTRAIEEHKVANGGSVIVMEPSTGDVLAMVSLPDFDPNNPKAKPEGSFDWSTTAPGVGGKSVNAGLSASDWTGNRPGEIKILQETVWRNKAVMDTYEPGSTFKAFTSAAGLEEGVVQKDTPTSDKTIAISGKNINCWKPNAHGNEPFYEGVYNSCNPVFVKVALKLGVDKFYEYIKKFGFYDKTGITLSGESKSIFHKKPKEIDMAVASFGQRFQISPMQLVVGYTSLVNGGRLMKPRLVKEIRDNDGKVIKTFEPEAVRTCISERTSRTLNEILEGVVTEGSGKNAYVKGYRVAGKTGTSETTEEGHYISSFCGYAPADNPRIIVLVVLDNPRGGAYYGGIVAAPVAGRIFDATLNYLGIERKYTEKDKENMAEEIFVPDVRGKQIFEAEKIFKKAELSFKLDIENTTKVAIVVDQMPKPGAFVAKKSVIVLYTKVGGKQDLVGVPDLKGTDVKEAWSILQDYGLNIRVNGLGKTFRQQPAPGVRLPKGSVVHVEMISEDAH